MRMNYCLLITKFNLHDQPWYLASLLIQVEFWRNNTYITTPWNVVPIVAMENSLYIWEPIKCLYLISCVELMLHICIRITGPYHLSCHPLL